MGQRLKDKIAIITGAGSGIGAATAVRFVEEGAKVLLVDINEIGLVEVSQQIQNEEAAKYQVADIRVESAIEACVQIVVRTWGRVDILVNNAGLGNNVPLQDATNELMNQIWGVNLRAPILFCKHVIPHMTHGGAIVNVASISSTSGIPGQAVYGPSKGGILQFTKQLAIEYAQKNIRVNAVAPGSIETPMLWGDDPEASKPLLDWLLERHPIGRFGKPAEVANAILFLASDEASYITGADLPVDGGYTAQ